MNSNIKIINITRGTDLITRGEMALNFWRRLKGLLFTDSLLCGQGIVIKPCSSIHTIGMSYYIDILFVNAEDIIVKSVVAMKPYRMARCTDSIFVIELPAGTVQRTGTQIGDKVVVLNNESKD
jgi:uncharacterized membrane protein (UPF0127 family)